MQTFGRKASMDFHRWHNNEFIRTALTDLRDVITCNPMHPAQAILNWHLGPTGSFANIVR